MEASAEGAGRSTGMSVPVLLAAAAAFGCFGGLTAQSFWLDEHISGTIAAEPAAVILTRSDGEAPLYPLLLHGLVRAGLDSDWWLRFPSALAVTLAVPLLLMIGREIEDRRVAVIAAALLALHPLALWHAQEARAYALMMLMGLASTAIFLRLLRPRVASWVVPAYALSASIGIGVHYYFVFVVAAHGITGLVDAVACPERRRRWLAAGALTLLGVVPWGILLVPDFVGQSHVDGQVVFSWLALPYTALSYVGGFSFGPPLRVLHPASRRHVAVWVVVQPYFVSTVFAIYILAVLLGLGLARPVDRRRLLVILLAAIPVFGPWICSNFGVGFRPRYTLPALPFVLLLVAGALRSHARRAAFVFLPVLALVEVYAASQMTAPSYAREDARGAAAFITASGRPGRIVAIGEGSEPVERYLAHPERVRVLGPTNTVDRAHLENFAKTVGRDDEDLFLVESREWTRDPDEVVQAYLDRHRPLRGEHAGPGTQVRWYGPVGDPPGTP